MAPGSWWTGYGHGDSEKDAARLDEWAKDVAPSSELRTWYQHDPAKLDEFRRRYTAELAQPGPREALARLRSLAAEEKPVTLLTATKDLALSHAPDLGPLAAGERLAGRYRRAISFQLPAPTSSSDSS